MALFSRTNRPKTDELHARIDALRSREGELPGAIADAKADLTRALATGADASKHRARVVELTAEAESIPEAIASLTDEIHAAGVEERLDNVAEMERRRDKALDAAAKAWARVESALERYRDEATGIDWTGVPRWAIDNLASYAANPRVVSPIAGLADDTKKAIEHERQQASRPRAS
jgi:hypothetical protein